jgi:hypothetical protein
MSKKWQRNKAWEDANLTGAWTPLRLVLRAFSSIPLAVVLLLFVSLYAVLASIPIGMLARIPTLLIVLGLYVALLAIPMLLWALLVRRTMGDLSKATRFIMSFVVMLAMGVGLSVLWVNAIWPNLKYHTSDGSGFMLFTSFVEQYKSTTVRRLPMLEMTELEFYAWWPMRLALILFVINMIVATVRRIDFSFRNLGVLSVHTGIVVIALGSIFYQRFKLEGDTLLPAGTGTLPGPAQRAFYDREDVALYVAQARTPNAQPRFEQRALNALPLYNAYGLNAGIPEDAITLSDIIEREFEETDNGRTLNQRVPNGLGSLVDPDIKFRIVGFAPYATLDSEWYQSELAEGESPNPYRRVDLHFNPQAEPGVVAGSKPFVNFNVFTGDPANRTRANDVIALEYTRDMSDQRWEDLRQEFRVDFQHGLIIEVPGTDRRIAVPVVAGTRIPIVNTPWTVVVDQLAPEPPFPIITSGYENASSSVAIVKIIKAAQGDEPAKEFDRWVYHRFPELTQDLTPVPGGQPQRSDPDPGIRVSYIDATKLQIFLDEQTDEQGNTRTRSIVRQAGGSVRTTPSLTDGWLFDLIPNPQGDRLDLHIAAQWENASEILRPIPVPLNERDSSVPGSYREALVGVEVILDETPQREAWSKLVWLPFAQYVSIQQDQRTRVTLPDGRNIMLVFGRYQREFPGFELALVDFEMIAYDHRGAPRDYQSIVQVLPNPFYGGPQPRFESFQHVVKLNNPLRAPFHWDPEKSWITNTITRLRAGMDPNQFKLSQSGWDRNGWEQSQELVDQGVLPEPRANFTILGVGNNPGIHVIAFGSILISLGIPWAFYLKPYLVRREKRRLAEMHAQPKPKEAHA